MKFDPSAASQATEDTGGVTRVSSPIFSRDDVLDLRMRVDACRGYGNFKAHVTTTAHTNGKHVSAQDGHIVGQFVVAARWTTL